MEYLRIDDPIGAVPVHGMAGIWGTLSLGLFATGQFGITGPYGADKLCTQPGKRFILWWRCQYITKRRLFVHSLLR